MIDTFKGKAISFRVQWNTAAFFTLPWLNEQDGISNSARIGKTSKLNSCMTLSKRNLRKMSP